MTSPNLDDIMSGREPASVEQDHPEGEGHTGRDEQGRFARQQRDEQPEPQEGGDAPEPERQPGTVPRQALEAERRKRQERDDRIEELLRQNAEIMSRQMQAQQPSAPVVEPPKAPVFWEDPEAAADYRARQLVDPVRQEFANYKLQMSKQMNVQAHGQETVDAAVQGVMQLKQSNPAEFQRLEALAERSFDPVGDLVRWHKQQRTLQEVGEDPAAYKARLRAEILAEMQAESGAEPSEQQPAAKPPLPTSFASQRSGAPRGGTGFSGPRPLSEIMGR